ncbi:NAD(P)-binding protein [Wallemia mellicola]|uniref:NAD(P)-binding protein n=1 Tax=Wallemia mellicola TaxID=1708541 RepID=A0A4T0NE35_9BASI|nr:NAD(P)-binding protein [Wallemia mellicola]
MTFISTQVVSVPSINTLYFRCRFASVKDSHVSVDLLNSSSDEIAESLVKGGAGDATHAFFFSYIAKDDEDELIDVNFKLFSNSVEALHKGTKVKSFLLQTGYKYYGAFVGGEALQPYPWVEDSGRYKGKNFYFKQEDYLRESAVKYNWKWVIARPNFITGVSLGNFMSIATTVALYAVACKELNTPFYFPGSKYSYHLQYDHSNAKNNAEFEVFALDNPKAVNKVFNIHDGAHNSFDILWPKIARYFGLALPEPVAEDVKVKEHQELKSVHSVQKWAEENKDKFGAIVKKYNLDPKAYEHATWPFLDGATSRTWPDKGNLDAARSIGWKKTIDSFEDGYKAAFDKLKQYNVIPKTFE